MHNGEGNRGFHSNQYYGDGGQQNRSGDGLNNSNVGHWQGHGHGQRHDNNSNQSHGYDGQESFQKFRDPQRHPKQNKGQGQRRSGGGGGKGRGGGGGGGGSRGGGGGGRRRRRNSGGFTGSRRERRGVHGNSGPPGTLFFYDTMGNGNIPNDATEISPSPLNVIQPTPNTILSVPNTLIEPQINLAPSNQEVPMNDPAETKPTPPAIHIKQEKKDTSATKAIEKKESSEESSSSDSDDSFEAGEVVKAAATSKAVVKAPAQSTSSSSSSSSDSSESEAEEKEVNSTKTKSSTKDQVLNKSVAKKLKKIPSEDDVVCMGQEKRHFTIPDDDEDENETDGSKKIIGKRKNKDKSIDVCNICDKKGHNSFQCQMICRNCSAPYHNFKHCPSPVNLSTALQLFMEFNMHQFTTFNLEQRFTFAGSTPATAPLSSTPLKSKKDKKSSSKKTKKLPKKKMKIEQKDDDDDDEDESDNDDDAAAANTDDSDEDSSESSDEPQPPPAIKQKRKRSSKQKQQIAPPGNLPPPQAFPFPLLAPGAPYNSMMYPYGAAFSYPK
ncbi:protein mushroom body miniature [Drosophila willistoni]|uniref:protein mushroom body miniature n=1 Tax=Drosophila willistoni TaxID=7260 RepID=UPI001F0825E1|nr:protein mushroom body miniature [Drosophila willistoni]